MPRVAAIPARDLERDALIVAHVPLAKRMAGAASSRRMWRNHDALSDALFGLFKAACTYDPAHGVPFKDHAGNRIAGAILDGQRLGNRYKTEHGQACDFVSLERALRVPTPGKSPFTLAAESEQARNLRGALGRLDPRERHVITELVFKGRTQAAISGDFGVTQVRIYQIYARALRKLRRDQHVQWHQPLGCDQHKIGSHDTERQRPVSS